jgi:hypothetical protein
VISHDSAYGTIKPLASRSRSGASAHAAVRTAIRQIAARFRSRLLVRVDGADASDELITHLLSLSAAAWNAAVDHDGAVQEDKHVTETTHLFSLTALERATGWRYFHHRDEHPAAGGIPACPAATTPSSSTCSTASTPSSRTGEDEQGDVPAEPAIEGLGGELRLGAGREHRRRPVRLVPAARLVRLRQPQGRRAGRAASGWHLPVRLARHARARVLKISRTWPWEDAFLACWQRLRALPEPA